MYIYIYKQTYPSRPLSKDAAGRARPAADHPSNRRAFGAQECLYGSLEEGCKGYRVEEGCKGYRAVYRDSQGLGFSEFGGPNLGVPVWLRCASVANASIYGRHPLTLNPKP